MSQYGVVEVTIHAQDLERFLDQAEKNGMGEPEDIDHKDNLAVVLWNDCHRVAGIDYDNDGFGLLPRGFKFWGYHGYIDDCQENTFATLGDELVCIPSFPDLTYGRVPTIRMMQDQIPNQEDVTQAKQYWEVRRLVVESWGQR